MRLIEAGRKKFATSNNVTRGQRASIFLNWLSSIIAIHTPDRIFYEEVKHHGKQNGVRAAHLYGGFQILTELASDRARIPPPLGISPTTIKKHATGLGRADKRQMIQAASKHFPGVEIASDDVADSLEILRTGFHLLDQKTA